MKKFTEILTEKYKDSTDATEDMDKAQSIINSKNLMNWAKLTDENYGTKTVAKLKKVIKEYDSFINEVYTAGE